jgi:hypothetical protein
MYLWQPGSYTEVYGATGWSLLSSGLTAQHQVPTSLGATAWRGLCAWEKYKETVPLSAIQPPYDDIRVLEMDAICCKVG